MPVELLLNYRRTSRYALNVLGGAVAEDPSTRSIPIGVARSLSELSDLIRRARASGRRPVIAWSFYSASLPEVVDELATLRGAFGEEPLHVAGGPHPTADPEGVLRSGFDLVAIGEGERTLPALLASLHGGEDPRAVPGLAWLEAGAFRTSGRSPPVDLDSVPANFERCDRINPIEITRGCAWGCRFCQTPFLFKARWRHRSIAAVRRAVRFMRGSGARDVRFITPSALSYGAAGKEVDLDAVEALLVGVREEAGNGMRVFLGSFPSELRPEHVSPRALGLLRRHCDNRTVILGAQSGSDRLLAAAGRGHDAEAVERAVALAVEAGLEPWVDFVFGLPGEREADREATRAQISRLADAGARIHAHAFMALPGTPWEAEPPGGVDDRTALLLDRLASRGRSHGPWRTQRSLGRSRATGPPLGPPTGLPGRNGR